MKHEYRDYTGKKISNAHKISEIFAGNIYLLKVIGRHIYRVVGNWWYKRKEGDTTRKKKSKI